jgi:uncharacterized coiled-coil protein SlyX
MKEITQKYILANYSQSFVENLIVKLSPVSRFGIQYLSERISVLEDKLDFQEKINLELTSRLDFQEKINLELTSKIALLIKTVSELTSQIALLIKNNSDQEIKIKILSDRIKNISNDQNKKKDNYYDHQNGDL